MYGNDAENFSLPFLLFINKEASLVKHNWLF